MCDGVFWCRQCRLWRWWQCDACNIGFGDSCASRWPVQTKTENQGIQRQLHKGSSSPVVIILHSASHGTCICWAKPLHLIGKFCKTMKWPDDTEHLQYNSAESLLLQFCYVAWYFYRVGLEASAAVDVCGSTLTFLFWWQHIYVWYTFECFVATLAFFAFA